MKKVLITGISGQIGSFLAEEFLKDNYEAHGLVRRTSQNNLGNIENILDKVHLHIGDITDISSLLLIFNKVKPDMVVNCAAMSEVGTSFTNPLTTWDITGKGPLNLLEIIRQYYPDTRFLQFSSSEQFGCESSNEYDLFLDFNYQTFGNFQYEKTRMSPNSPYAIAKLAAYHTTKVYRDSYGLFSSNIIAFNSESERRGEYFVTRKITKWLGQFKNWCNHNRVFSLDDLQFNDTYFSSCFTLDKFPKLRLGNIDSQRDWCAAQDTARGAKLIIEHDKPDDFCIAGEKVHSIREFLSEAFKSLGKKKWEPFVYIDKDLFRPKDLTYLKGHCAKARQELEWQPTVTFQELVQHMVDADVEKEKTKKIPRYIT